MNKGFAFYFRQAFKNSIKTIWKNKQILQSMIYFFMSCVARLSIVLGPMIDLADVRQAKIAKNQHKIDVPQSLTRASQRPLWTMIVARVLEGLIYLGGFLLLSVGCAAIMAIALVIASVAQAHSTLIYVIFAVPCLIIYALYTIIMSAVFSPTAYVIDSNPTLPAGEVVSVCFATMKNRGLITAFLTSFIPALIELLILGVCAAVMAILVVFAGGNDISLFLYVLWGIISAVILLLTIPVCTLTKNHSQVLLFEDVALDPVNVNRRTAGINIKKISGARVDREEVADNLSALFDPAIEEKTPEGENLQHKHRKKTRAAVKMGAEDGAAEEVKVAALPEVEIEDVDEYPEDTVAAQQAQQVAQQQAQQAAQRVAQQPVYGGQPAQAQQPVYGSQPAQAQQPAYGSQPQQAQQPVYGGQPAQAQQPVYGSQPQQHAQQPVYGSQPQQQAQQPVYGSQPQQPQQPVYGGQPAQAQQSVYGSQPQQAQQPVYGSQPTQTVQQPVYGSQPQQQAQQPVYGNQPAQAHQPVYGSQPAQQAQQSVYGQPAQTAQPQQPVYGQPTQQQPQQPQQTNVNGAPTPGNQGGTGNGFNN